MQVVHGYKPPRLAARRSSTAVTSGPPGPDTVASSIAGPARSISIHNMVPKWATRPSVRGAECRAAVRLKVMQMAVDVASFTPAEADQLRRAMGAKRSSAKMRALMARFFTGCAANGLDRELATRVFEQIHAFSGYGFPEAHSMSFALLVYASTWFKRYYPAAFCAGLLRAQPMGFYSPQSLVADARRHGVQVRQPDINLSVAHATLEPLPGGGKLHAIRAGLGTVRTIGEKLAEQIVAERAAYGPFEDMADVARRVRLTTPQVEALATA